MNEDAGLMLKPGNCDFCCTQVEFLGHVSADGVRTDPTKTEKVSDGPSRRHREEFLGLANYY